MQSAVDFPPYFTKSTTLVISCFGFSACDALSEKGEGSTLKGKNLLPVGVDPGEQILSF